MRVYEKRILAGLAVADFVADVLTLQPLARKGKWKWEAPLQGLILKGYLQQHGGKLILVVPPAGILRRFRKEQLREIAKRLLFVTEPKPFLGMR